MDQVSSLLLVEVLNRASAFLKQNDQDLASAQVYWMYYKDWNLTDIVQHLYAEIPEHEVKVFFEILNRVVNGEPIQYILGRSQFMDTMFKVTPHTLIPREETQGLVKLILNDYGGQPLNILDIGTGSGAIAIMLKKLSPKFLLTAIDISDEAIAVAIENAKNIKTNVNFVESDLFKAIKLTQQFDIIVSNPPYISNQELDLMDESVKKYEPHIALFAENDGLAFYQRIAEESKSYIHPQGTFYLEIGFKQGLAVREIFQRAYPDARIVIQQDFNQKDRYVIVYLNGGAS